MAVCPGDATRDPSVRDDVCCGELSWGYVNREGASPMALSRFAQAEWTVAASD